ncbi:MAG: PglZ domain-containing protein [Desulfobacteraceae bacterium]|nr:PglZ domain-containing protein [Desulfobacteraceae bacterium]
MTKLSDKIRNMIARQVKNRGIVVWYDPEKAYAGLVQDLDFPETTVLQYADSFFRLRHELEPHLEFVTAEAKPKDGCGVAPNVIVYIPMERGKTSFALIEAEAAGVVVEPGAESLERNSRLRVQAESFFLEVAPEKAAHLARQVEEGLLTLEDLDRISEEVGSITSGALKLVFGAASPIESIIEFASGSGKDAKISQKKAIGELRSLVQSELGLDFGDTSSPKEARRTLRRMILLAEFTAAIPEAGRPPALGPVSLPEKPVQLDALKHLCETWRNRVDFRDGYIQAARDLEEAAGIAQMKLNPGDVEAVETFPCIESLLIRSAQIALLEGRMEEAACLAKSRKKSFWSREQPELLLRWSAMELGGSFIKEAAKLRDRIKKLDFSASEMIRAYALFSEPWMMADRLHRHFESRLLNLDPDETEEDDFEKFTAKVRRKYADLTDELNRTFVGRFQKAGFEIEGILPQARIFCDRVDPALAKKKKTVFFLVDALRYEMASELLEGMDKDFDVTLEPAISSLPSITSIGMASLLPGAEKGLDLVSAKGGLTVVLEGRPLKDRKSRLAYMEEKVSGRFMALKLANVLRLGAKRKKELKEADLIVVTSQEIDRLGEDGDDYAETRRFMDDMLEQLRRSIRILAKLGVEHFIITADHGYLFNDQIDPGLLMDSPGGTVLELHPRVWIGKGGTDAKGYVRVAASELEFGGDLEMAFPRGLSCFRVRGGVGGYFHGGISLQEMVIPVAVLQSKASAGIGAATGIQVRLEFGKPLITNRFFSMVATFDAQGLFPPEVVRVRAAVLSKKKEVGFCAMAAYGYEEGSREITMRKNEPNALTFMLSEDTGVEKVTVQIVDCHTQLELASMADVPVKLGI